MGDLLDTLLARSGKTRDDIRSNSRMGQVLNSKGVRDGEDIDRALALARRRWDRIDDLEGLVRDMTKWLKTPTGTWSLRAIQAVALLELHDLDGVFAPIRVGGGKTLISLLAPIVVESRRPLLIVPASLRDKTREDLKIYRKHFKIKAPTIESYATLSREENADYLLEYEPDLLMLDEVQKARNPDSAVKRRIDRYLRQHPDTKVLAMSGSVTNRSIKDYAHIITWCLGEDRQPLPTKWKRLEEWALALDEKISPTSRRSPGALARLCGPGEPPTLQGVRKAYQRRLVETPGVIASQDPPLKMGLHFREVPFDPPQIMTDHFRTLRELWETPDGHPCADAVTIWRHARELCCGFYYVWDPRPPSTKHPIKPLDLYRGVPDADKTTWLDARKEWCRYARYVLKHNRRGLDTERQVRTAVEAGEIDTMGFETLYEAEEILRAWLEIAPTFKPNNKPVWFDDTMINLAADWLDRNEGICWVEHVAFGERLSRMTGIPYYGQQGRNRQGGLIGDARGPVIASIASCGTGHNLQHYCRNLVVSCPTTGDLWEQMVGRTHRDGQKNDVTFDIVLPCLEQLDGFKQAIKDARYASDTTGQIMKLTYADLATIDFDKDDAGALARSPLWIKYLN